MWPLPKPRSQSEYCREISFGSDFGRENSEDVPRRIRVTNSGRILTVTNYGELCVFVDDKWQCVAVDKRFESYCLFELTDDRRYVCLASINGDVKIYEGCRQLKT